MSMLTCKKCHGGYFYYPKTLFGQTAKPDSGLCGECDAMARDDGDEVCHSRGHRCPACGHFHSICSSDDHELYNDGEHDVSCQECGAEYQISTDVSFTFVSPPRANGGGA